ncbi:hypothetical protein FACS1894188_08280 [Clostridia bacterium]|nr:hypothetical protein FACS1894188_08280 [Clostridia bacterium]
MDWLKTILGFLGNRLFVLLIVFVVCFYNLILNLYDLQIIHGEEYTKDLREITTKKLAINAPRGNIYDKYGRPLAVNVTTYTIKLNPGAAFDQKRLNDTLYDLIKMFEKNGEKYIDEFPISKDEPFEFNFSGSQARESLWRSDMDIKKENKDVMAVFAQLRDDFGVDPNLPDVEARKIVSLRSAIYMKRYRKYSPITLATNVSNETMAIIEEESDKYIGIYVDTDSLREYPGGITFSHIVGYVGKINDSDIEKYEQYGYEAGDPVGKTGLEQALELNLRGTDGERTVEVDAATGLVLSDVAEIKEAVPGDKYFLTIDSKFQEQTYNILYSKLKSMLISRLTQRATKDAGISVKEVAAALVRSNSLSIKKVWQSEEFAGKLLKEYILGELAEADISTAEGANEAKKILADGVSRGRVSVSRIFLALYEQGVITATDKELTQMRGNTLSTLQFLVNKINADEITPQMVNLDPSTGSVVVVDVRTGRVLSAVSYPTYDNNRMATDFNEYFPIINSDLSAPTYFRAFQERRAPGSTFKMITAIAGLERGAITPNSTIYDETVFKKAGLPYLRCWSSSSHGSINVSKALQVSCNYFFAETAYRLSSSKNGGKNSGIYALNEYMKAFGLNERTGVEIGEAYDSRGKNDEQIQISSPEYREYLGNLYKTETKWQDGDTVATAIGQAINNYTAATMAKYTMILANRGTRYKLYMTERHENYGGDFVEISKPVTEGTIEVKDSTWKAVYTGMYNVTHAVGATGYSTFNKFPISVGGKTGTAQEDLMRRDHTSFAGFAPFDDPQIAVYVVIPFGDTPIAPAAAAHIGRDVIGAYMGLGEVQTERQKVNALYR